MHRVALPLLLVAAALTGCASASSGRDDAAAAVERFYAAVEQRDGAAACEQLSAAMQLALESQAGDRPCREVVTRLDLAAGEVERAEVFVTNAKVDLTTDETAFLSRGPEGWRLSAIGCKPPAREDGPFACEVEA